MTVLPDLELASGYFTTRLLAARSATQLGASEQFDLARSPLSDDELEDIVDQFRDTPQPRDGWGFAPMLNELLSSQPKSVPVQDLQKLQQNLVAHGYAAPTQQATGQWDPSWYASLRRFDRDNYEKQRQGYHWYSAPVMSGINAMTNTLPSRVFQGIVGTAKGFVLQAPETAERLGLLGGAAAGAGIGTLIAPGIGTAIGGAIGGGIGLLADLFGEEDEELDQSALAGFLDVLSPWEEYRDSGPKAMWEDLGWILTAASIASGAGTIARGVGAGARGISAARAGVPAPAGTAPGVTPGVTPITAPSVIPGTTPGVGVAPMSLGRALMAPTASKELGFFGTISRAASAKYLKGTPAELIANANKLSPIAFMQRTGPKIALDTFAGLSQIQMGGRLFGGLGQGSKQKYLEAKAALEAELGRSLTEDEGLELAKKTATSTIEKSIATAPLPQTGIDIPLVGDAIDLAAFALYPQKLLPFGGGRGLAVSAERMMGDTGLGPYVHALAMNRKVGVATARAEARETVDAGVDAYMRLDFGIEAEATRMMDAAFGIRKSRPSTFNEMRQKARAAVIEKLHAGEEQGRSFATELMKYSYADETAYTAHLLRITNEGSGIERFSDFQEASRLAVKVMDEVKENTRYVRDEAGEIISARADLPVEPRWETFDTPAGPVKQRITSEEVALGGVPRTDRNLDVVSIEQAIEASERRLKTYERFIRRGATPRNMTSAQQRKLIEESNLRRLKESLKVAKRPKDVQVDRFNIVPATQDFMTKQMAQARKAEYIKARDELLAAKKADDPMALEVANQNHLNLVENLTRDGIIDEAIATKVKNLDPGDLIVKEIDDFARGAAADVELPEPMMKAFGDLGYKPVTAGDDVLRPEEVGRLVNLSAHDVGDYTKRAAVWETLALSPKLRTDQSLFKLRREAEKAELQEALDLHGIRLSSDQAFRRLKDEIDRINHQGSVKGPVNISREGKMRLYKVDPRDLTVDDIFRAFEDVPGFTDDTARDVYGAIRRGAAYGHELRLMKPVSSAYAAGRLLRLNGLPGFADLVRTWNLQVPTHFDRKAWKLGTVAYKPKAALDKAYDLAHSPQRARAERALYDTAAKTNIPAQQRDVAMMMLDTVAESSVRQGRFQSVDDFYRHLDAAYAERYVEAAEARANELTQILFRRVADAPRTKGPEKAVSANTQIWERDFSRFTAHMAKYDGTPSWYENSAEAFHRLFAGSEITLRDGKAYPLEDVMARIVAETSGGKYPTDNLASALKAVRTFLEDKSLRHADIKGGSGQGYHQYGKNVYRKVDQILDGNFPDTAKYGPFYRAVKGKLDEVVVDRRMAIMFGVDHGSMTDIERDFIANTVTELATRLGVKPGHAQERLWMSFNDIVDENLALARRQGDEEAIEFYEGVSRVRDDASQDYGVLVAENVPTRRPKNKADQPPGIRDLVEETFGPIDEKTGALRQRLFQMAADDVLGMTAWGPEGLQVMRFFRNADFTTLVHENAHLMRRLIAPEDLNRIEKILGLAPGGGKAPFKKQYTPVKLLDMRKAEWRSGIKNVVKKTLSDADGDGGATWNPRTGEMVAPKPGHGVVAIREGTDMVIPAGLSEEEIGQRLSKFASDHRKELEDPEAFLGTWRNEDGSIDVDVSEMGKTERVAELAQLRQQKAYFSFDTFEDVPVEPAGVWDRAAEERFAEMAERYVAGKADPDIENAFKPVKESLRVLWGKVRGEAVNSNYIGRGMRKELDKLFPIPEQFAPPSLTKSLARGTVNRQTAGGAALGAIAGAYEGREDGVLDSDILAGAMFGAGAGLVGRKLGKRNYGYLPDSLMRMNTALRYSLSLTFDAGRFTEQNMIAMAKHGLPPMLSPKKYTRAREWKTPYRNGSVKGDDAWTDAVRFWDELNGTNIYASIDDLDRRLFQRGMLGFSPRDWEVAQAWQLYQRGWSADKISEAVAQIGRYGIGRTAAEKSANFVVFPFSFSKKFLTTLGDFILQAPGRNLLLHEASRRYYESEADERFDELMKRHFPLLQELATVNSLAFGISPGRFFLQGLSDHRTATGTAAQAISSFFVPSGAATSLAQAAGNAADLAVNAFVPVVITGESVNRAGGINNMFDVFRRYVPLIREIDQYFIGAGELGGSAASRQLKALMEGGDPYWQFTNYMEGVKTSKAQLEPLAAALGYASVDGLLQSERGAVFQQQLDAEKEVLRQELPTGFAMSQTFENDDAMNAAALMDLANKSNRSPGEDKIVSMMESLEAWKLAVSNLNIDPEMMQTLQAARLREQAMESADDPRFVELWNRFFLRDYGPIRRVA